MTIAAIWIADMKACAQRSKRMAIRRQSSRKGHNGLVALVQNHLHKDLFTTARL